MSKHSPDWFFKNATECLISAMTSEPGSADERRYLAAVQIFTRAAEGARDDAA
jgi:hypothetical protein